MVRTYKKKKVISWTKEKMDDALSDITNNQMTVYKAAQHYKIPQTTLWRHVRNPTKSFKVGAPTALTADQEKEIVAICQVFAEWGFGLTKKDVINVVAEYFRCTKKPNPFTDGIPHDDWWAGFQKRNPSLVSRKPQNLQMARANAATPSTIDHWFSQCLKPMLEKLTLMDCPQWVFNVDESGFPLSGNTGKVLMMRGTKSPQAVIGGSGRDYITVQTCISGDGTLLPP